MELLRLDYFLSVGGSLSMGDVYTSRGGEVLVVQDIDSGQVSRRDSERYIKSFFWRDQCLSGFQVGNGTRSGELGYNANTILIDSKRARWKPSIEVLIMMQSCFDFHNQNRDAQ